jgi:CHAD domain-containing protein
MHHASTSGSGPGIALRDYGLAELTTAIEALATRGNRLHAGIHQARKAIRRTRAMLALGGAVLGAGAELIDRQLRRLNRRLSPLRDMHALVQTLDRLGIKARDEPTRMALDRARRMAARRRADLSRKPEFVRTLQEAQAVLVTLRAALQGLPWDSLATSMVTEAMTSSAREAKSARQRACAHGDAEDWHRWRRRMRRVSQQQRAVIAVGLDAPASRFDKHLTEQLGVLQDLSLLVAYCDKESPFPKPTRLALQQLAERTLVRQRKRIRSVVAHL